MATRSTHTETPVFTADDVRAKLVADRESDEPDAILAVLKAHDGKQLTKRLLAKLPGGEARWLIRQVAGMTKLEDRHYLHSGGGRGISLLVAYQLTSVVIDAAWVEEHNAAYFAARVERNAMRAVCVCNPAICQRMADTLTAYAAAKAALDDARQALDGLTEYGQPFSPDQYDWQRLCGAYEEP
jgi:hypothetical protein